jgi:hypothetical protein
MNYLLPEAVVVPDFVVVFVPVAVVTVPVFTVIFLISLSMSSWFIVSSPLTAVAVVS